MAALETKSGEELSQTVPRHTSAALCRLPRGDIVAGLRRGQEVHLIAENHSTHKTQAVRTFLLEHPNVQLHFTPRSSSWLYQVELWSAKIERDLLVRIDDLIALTIATELGDPRPFPSARVLIAYVGLIPSEHSSGTKRARGAVTKTGNAHLRRVLIEAA